jgi:hypothetical protein
MAGSISRDSDTQAQETVVCSAFILDAIFELLLEEGILCG